MSRKTTSRRPVFRRLGSLLLAGLLVALTACGGGVEGQVEWRDLTLQLPDGWLVDEQASTVLGLTNAVQGEPGDRGDRQVYVQMTFEPDTLPDDWRRFVEEQGGRLEEDADITVDGLPGTRLVFAFTTNDTPTREMIVLVPSRQIVMLLQPVVAQGETDGPDRFLRNREVFDRILDSIDFGAPLR